MFWLDDFSAPKLQRAWMDGSHAQNILYFNVLPNDLVLDFIKERVYWVNRVVQKIK